MLDLMLVDPLYWRSGPLDGGAKPTIFSTEGVDRVPHAHREALWMLDLMLVDPLYRRSGPLDGGAKPTIFSTDGVDWFLHAHREAHWMLDLMLDPLYRRSGPSDGGAKPTMIRCACAGLEVQHAGMYILAVEKRTLGWRDIAYHFWHHLAGWKLQAP